MFGASLVLASLDAWCFKKFCSKFSFKPALIRTYPHQVLSFLLFSALFCSFFAPFPSATRRNRAKAPVLRHAPRNTQYDVRTPHPPARVIRLSTEN